MDLRSVSQEQTGQTPWRSGAFLAYIVPRNAPHFLTAPPSYALVAFPLRLCEKHLRYGKLATSSVLAVAGILFDVGDYAEQVASFVNCSNLLKSWEKTDTYTSSTAGAHGPKNIAIMRIPTHALSDLYSAYGRQGWGGRVRQNLPPGHAHFHRRRCLPPWAIKRSAPFAKRPANRPARSPQPLSPLARGRSDHRLVLAQVHPEAPPTPPQRRRRPGPAAPTAPPAAAARAAPGGALAPEADEPTAPRPPARRPP